MTANTAVPAPGLEPVPVDGDGILVRPMTEADLDDVSAIEASTSPEPWSRSLLADELDLPADTSHWLVAEHELSGAVVGFAGTMVVADEAHVLNIAVHPDRRRRGVGRRLLTRILEAGRQRGAVATTLEVRSRNRSALALYASSGFRRAGRRPGYYRDGTDAVIMWPREPPGGTP